MQRPLPPPPPTVTGTQWLNRNHLKILFLNGGVMSVTPLISQATGLVIGLKQLEFHFRGSKIFEFVGKSDAAIHFESNHRLIYALPATDPRTLARFWKAAADHFRERREKLLQEGRHASRIPDDLDRAWRVFTSREAEQDLKTLAEGGTR